MALVKSLLKSGIKALMVTNPSTVQAAATQWGNAYDAYARVGQANSIPGAILPAVPPFPPGPIPTSLNAQSFSAVLLPLFTAGNSTAPAAGGVFAAAVNAYWFLPPVVFGTGVVTAVAGLAALIPMFNVLQSTEDAAAESISTFLDAATKTVTVTFTLPPGVFTLV